MKLMMAQSAYNNIEKEVLAHYPLETGGIHVGRRVYGYLVVPFTIGSGDKPERSPTLFSPDFVTQQEMLDRLYKEYSVNYMGEFHLHPMKLSRLSGIDKLAIHRIMTNPDYNIEEAIFTVVNIEKESVVLHPYYATRDDTDLIEIRYEVIPDDDPLIKYTLGIPKVIKRKEKEEVKPKLEKRILKGKSEKCALIS